MSHVTTIPESYNVYDMTLASPPVGELLWSRPLDPSANHERPGNCFCSANTSQVLYVFYTLGLATSFRSLQHTATLCNTLLDAKPNV